ncbi:MAG TPA: cytosine permease, partial [Candidatus Xenobia bacterium]
TITGIIGILICPWKLLSSVGAYIFTWLIGYSALLGPIAGIMICDFWVLRRKRLAVADLYRMDGRYHYSNGWNPLAVVALVLGVLPNIPGFIYTLKGVDAATATGFQGLALQVYAFAWLVGFAVAFVVYGVLMHVLQGDNIRQDQEMPEAQEGAVLV